jgi:hypothetical protein
MKKDEYIKAEVCIVDGVYKIRVPRTEREKILKPKNDE